MDDLQHLPVCTEKSSLTDLKAMEAAAGVTVDDFVFVQVRVSRTLQICLQIMDQKMIRMCCCRPAVHWACSQPHMRDA